MNTRDLQYFVALVKYKNYTQVAKLFKVSQPTITQSIQRLERCLLYTSDAADEL